MLFEIIWYKLQDTKHLNTVTLQSSMGIISAYCIYVGGYIITQILTPLSLGQFYMNNLLVLLPEIFSSGLLAALLGAGIVPLFITLRSSLRFSLEDRIYYPATLGISIVCWCSVIINWFSFGA
jgi:hypothetical protein